MAAEVLQQALAVDRIHLAALQAATNKAADPVIRWEPKVHVVLTQARAVDPRGVQVRARDHTLTKCSSSSRCPRKCGIRVQAALVDRWGQAWVPAALQPAMRCRTGNHSSQARHRDNCSDLHRLSRKDSTLRLVSAVADNHLRR